MSWGGPVTACVTAAIGLWCSFGVLAASASVQFPPRLGQLPALWLLIPLIVIGVSAGVSWHRWRPISRAWVPLFGSAVLIVPWLPGPLPAAFLTWAGPLVLPLWLFVGLAVLAASVSEHPGAATPWFDSHRLHQTARTAVWLEPPAVRLRNEAFGLASRHDARRGAITAATLAFIVYGVSAYWTREWRPGGDEPHYLVITQSLMKDGDLQIENNHRRADYLEYFPGELRPDYLQRGANGRIYSVHAPGLPALLVPAYAVAGYVGAVVFVMLLSAAGTGLAWSLAFEITQSASAAWFGWASVALTVPFLFHAFALFPDALSAVFVLTGVAALIRSSRLAANRLAVHGVLLAMLPWLHTRYAVLAGLLAAMIGLRLLSRPDRVKLLAVFLALPLLSAIGWFGLFWWIYGTPSPMAPYGSYSQSAVANIAKGLPALLLDSQFGLIPNAPTIVPALIGLVMMVIRGPSRLGLELLLLVFVYSAVPSAYGMWWGGSSAPARFLVAILLPLVIPAAVFWHTARAHVTRLAGAGVLLLTLMITYGMTSVRHGRLAYNDRDGYALWLEWVSPLVDLTRALPAFHRDSVVDALQQALWWIGVFCLAWLALVAMERRFRIQRPAQIAAALLVGASATMIAMSGAWTVIGATGITSSSSQAYMLEHLNDHVRPLELLYGERSNRPWNVRAVSLAQLASHMRLGTVTRRQFRDPPILLLRSVPAGTYRLLARSKGPLTGQMAVVIGNTPLATEDVPLSGTFDKRTGEWAVDHLVRLPVGVASLAIRGDESARKAIDSMVAQPVALGVASAVKPQGERGLEERIAARGARYGSTVAYFLDDQNFPEPGGFWIRPGVEVDIGLARDNTQNPVRLMVRNAPVNNTVTLGVGDWETRLSLGPGEERDVEIPFEHGLRAIRLRLHAAQGFRPSEADPNVRDMRMLGCWIEPR